jgi:hypothetical protein
MEKMINPFKQRTHEEFGACSQVFESWLDPNQANQQS